MYISGSLSGTCSRVQLSELSYGSKLKNINFRKYGNVG